MSGLSLRFYRFNNPLAVCESSLGFSAKMQLNPTSKLVFRSIHLSTSLKNQVKGENLPSSVSHQPSKFEPVKTLTGIEKAFFRLTKKCHPQIEWKDLKDSNVLRAAHKTFTSPVIKNEYNFTISTGAESDFKVGKVREAKGDSSRDDINVLMKTRKKVKPVFDNPLAICKSGLRFSAKSSAPKLFFRNIHLSTFSKNQVTDQNSLSSDPYKLLKIEPDATSTEIREAFFRQAKKCHPDIVGKDSKDFILLREAYKTLTNPVLKYEYDLTISEGVEDDPKVRELHEAEDEKAREKKRDDIEVEMETRKQIKPDRKWMAQFDFDTFGVLQNKEKLRKMRDPAFMEKNYPYYHRITKWLESKSQTREFDQMPFEDVLNNRMVPMMFVGLVIFICFKFTEYQNAPYRFVYRKNSMEGIRLEQKEEAERQARLQRIQSEGH